MVSKPKDMNSKQIESLMVDLEHPALLRGWYSDVVSTLQGINRRAAALACLPEGEARFCIGSFSADKSADEWLSRQLKVMIVQSNDKGKLLMKTLRSDFKLIGSGVEIMRLIMRHANVYDPVEARERLAKFKSKTFFRAGMTYD